MLRVFAFAILFGLATPMVRAADVVIFAASSLKTALDEVVEGTGARVSYGGSGALARQISQGAPADIFISANPIWMDAIAGNLAERADLLRNSLVIVSRDYGALKPDGRVAMGLLNSVPVGIYGKSYLQAEGLWDAITPRVVETDSARAALALAASGEVAFAVVYATDALAEPRVKVVRALPDIAELPILYPVALIDGSGPHANALYVQLQSPRAREIFTKHGFGAP